MQLDDGTRGLKFGTPRNPERPTRGTRQGFFATHMLGNPYMPWQQHVSDVAGELELDPETGLWLPYYSTIVTTVQRQAGKSHLALARTGERCMFEPGYRSWYTAQSGQDARAAFLKFAEQVEKSPLGSKVHTLKGMGHEVMRFPNRSMIQPYPPKEDSLHGEQADGVDIDEAWAFPVEVGRALLQASSPTKLTRPGSQTWMWSAGGTAASTWLAELVAQGRESTTDPTYTGRMAFFEYGIPDDADPEDLDVIAAHHPAVGHTITRRSLAAMREEFGDDTAGWARAAGNRWTEVIGGGIDDATWQRARRLEPIPDDAPVGFGAARSAAGDQVVLATAAQVSEQLVVIEVIEVRTTSWQAARHLDAWTRRRALAVWPNGPSASLRRDLVDLGRDDLVTMNQQDAVAATASMLDALEPGGIRFRQHPDLDAAVTNAALRRTSDGGKIWAPTSVEPIAALEAATAALAALRPTNQPEYLPETAVAVFG